MPKKDLDARIEEISSKAKTLGFSDVLSKALATISIKKRLENRVIGVIENYGADYQKLLEIGKEMWNDPSKFNFEKRGDKEFPTYSSLSLAYSNCSPYRIIKMILQDAKTVREEAKFYKMLNGCYPRYKSEYHVGLFEERRFQELQDAFTKDLLATGAKREVLETVLNSINFEKMPVSDYILEEPVKKQHALEGAYIFLTSKSGKELLRNWENVSERKNILEKFSYNFYNNPEVNPQLVNMERKDLKSKAFKKALSEFPEGISFSPNGESIKRKDIDGRKTFIYQ